MTVPLVKQKVTLFPTFYETEAVKPFFAVKYH
uniref:Uncharacterized protein n=1 Tax=Anguilla anguilla TaxID=7936 RepID=A0A0E9U8Y2_ANGAN